MKLEELQGARAGLIEKNEKMGNETVDCNSALAQAEADLESFSILLENLLEFSSRAAVGRVVEGLATQAEARECEVMEGVAT